MYPLVEATITHLPDKSKSLWREKPEVFGLRAIQDPHEESRGRCCRYPSPDKTIVLENINLYSYVFQILPCHLRRGWSFTLFLVLALWAGIAANANGYDHRPSNSSYNQSSGACSIGYGCR